jgi:xanthine dehydrogenase molybdopterin-binding subunit B
MSSFRYIGEKTVRVDGRQKASGALRYMADLALADMLFGALVHPECAHAAVGEIDAAEAERVPGVVKVVTAKDVPGLNRHGLILKDQPVFCDTEIRYRGDTLAAVVATSPEIAAQAAKLVKVKLRKLPEVPTAGEALQKTRRSSTRAGIWRRAMPIPAAMRRRPSAAPTWSWKRPLRHPIRSTPIWKPKAVWPDLFRTAAWRSGRAARTGSGRPRTWP